MPPTLATLPPLGALPPYWSELLLAGAALSLVYVLWNVGGLKAFATEVGEVLGLLGAVVMRVFHLPKRMRWFVSQLYAAAVGNLHVVLLVGLFIGMILALQTGIELARFGQEDQIGVLVAASLAREMGPFITAIVLAATYGSALAAELGTMSVSDELSALKVMSVDHVSFLVVPRVIALMVAAPLLTIVCDSIGILGGGFVAKAQLGVGWSLYLDSAFSALETPAKLIPLPKDVYAGLFKSVVFGGIIAVISCASGLRARGGALGVGRATSSAVRDSLIAVIISNYFLTWLFYQGV